MISEILDQFLHTIWGALLASLAAYHGASPIVCCLFSIVCILPRELVDQWPIERPMDTVIDLGFFGLGGLIIALIL